MFCKCSQVNWFMIELRTGGLYKIIKCGSLFSNKNGIAIKKNSWLHPADSYAYDYNFNYNLTLGRIHLEEPFLLLEIEHPGSNQDRPGSLKILVGEHIGWILLLIHEERLEEV